MKFDPHNVSGHYVLVGQTPVIERDLFKWAEWFETANRRVALDQAARRGSPRYSSGWITGGWRATVSVRNDGENWQQVGNERAGDTWVEAEKVHRAAVGELKENR